VSAVDSLSGSIPNATVPFQYVAADDVTALVGAPPYDAAAAVGDAGLTDAAAGDAGAPDAGAPEAGCPGGSP